LIHFLEWIRWLVNAIFVRLLQQDSHYCLIFARIPSVKWPISDYFCELSASLKKCFWFDYDNVNV